MAENNVETSKIGLAEQLARERVNSLRSALIREHAFQGSTWIWGFPVGSADFYKKQRILTPGKRYRGMLDVIVSIADRLEGMQEILNIIHGLNEPEIEGSQGQEEING